MLRRLCASTTGFATVAPCCFAAALLLTGCGTPPAKDFSGAWKPVNRYQTATKAIPLAQPYVFFASPMDGTLKTLLTRWSHDEGMTLSYRITSDYTLYAPVAGIHAGSAAQAAAELSAVYAPEGVSITVEGRQFVVRVAAPAKLGSGTGAAAG